jgi:hypothetical protein
MVLAKLNQDSIWTDSNINNAFIETTKTLKKTKYRVGQKFGYSLVDAVNEETYAHSTLIVTDNCIKKDHLPLWPEFYGNYFYDAKYESRAPEYLFNCFISRSCPFRQSWLYQFQKRGLFDQGLITFNLDYRGDPELIPLKGTVELFDILFKSGNEIFEAEHKILRDRVPYCNINTSLEQAIIDSKVSIVLETYFDRNDVIAFSEKIFRSIQLPRPMLLFSAVNAVQHLRQCGFDVLDDIVDHSYDLESNSITRQIMILDQLEVINKLCYTDTVVNRLHEASKHNQQRLKELSEQWPERFQKICDYLQNYK